MIRSNFCYYRDAYIHVKGILEVTNTVFEGAPVSNFNKKVIFKNCTPITNCTSEINNTKKDDTQILIY